MGKVLKVEYPAKCIGCELCVMEVQRQLKKVGLEGSPIRILKDDSGISAKVTYSIDLDPQVNKLDIQKVKKVCPTGVFSVSEEGEHEHLS